MAVLRLMEAGVPAVQIGLVETAVGIGGLLGAVAAPWIIDRFRTGALTVLIAWSFVPLVVPMVFWNNPLVVSLAIGGGLFLNPAGNAGIGAYRMALTPPDLQGRVQSTSQFVSMSVMPLAPVLAGVLLATLGGPTAVVVLGVLIAGVALIPTLSHSVRSVPRPAVWQAELAEAALLSSPEAPRRQLSPAAEHRGVDEGAGVKLDVVPQ
jgi:MFS family permease